ncbi:hypothetical protein NL868_001305 [Shigella flexneri]|nr:hypothetical protein [Shigella flexneri]
MKLFQVFNGYMGDGEVFCTVIAKDQKRAYELASEKFRESARNEDYETDLETYQKYGWDTSRIKKYRYDERYWTNLEVICLSDDLTKEYASEVRD